MKDYSFWIDTSEFPKYPELDKDEICDVIVIGGGIAGLSCALELAQRSQKVILLESSKLAASVTGYTTAKVTSQHDLIYSKIAKKHGKEKAKLYANAQETALKKIRETVQVLHIDCDFEEKDAYIFTEDKDYVEKLQQEALLCKELGLPAKFVEYAPLPYPTLGALVFYNQAQFHPRKYALGIAKEITRLGGKIYENTRAVDYEDGDTCLVKTNSGHKITAKSIIIATHIPFTSRGLYSQKAFAHKSYVLGFVAKEGYIPDGMFINAESPTRSIRTSPYENGKVAVFVGGEGHKVEGEFFQSSRLDNLQQYARENLNTDEPSWRWGTQDYMSADGLPFIGKLDGASKNTYVATAFGSWGMTNGVVSALLLTDMICKIQNPWIDVFDSTRHLPLLHGAKTLLKENLKAAEHFVLGHLAPDEDISHVDKLRPGQGNVFNKGAKKLAIYKDEAGELNILSARCTHQGCILGFNPEEKSWDCPCHASRFNLQGEVIQGPANKPLESESLE